MNTFLYTHRKFIDYQDTGIIKVDLVTPSGQGTSVRAFPFPSLYLSTVAVRVENEEQPLYIRVDKLREALEITQEEAIGDDATSFIIKKNIERIMISLFKKLSFHYSGELSEDQNHLKGLVKSYDYYQLERLLCEKTLKDPDAISVLFHFLKTSEPDFNSSNLIKIYKLADEFFLNARQSCLDFIILTANPKNEEYWTFAQNENLSSLKDKLKENLVKEFTNSRFSEDSKLSKIWQKEGKNFEKLDFNHSGLSDEKLEFLVRHCPNLRELNLAYCMDLTDNSIIAVANNLKQLTSLNVSGCEKLTDESINVVATNLLQLNSLLDAGCYQIILSKQH